MRRYTNTGLYLLAGLCIILLFFGGPGFSSTRSHKQLWNLGHVPAFALWTWLAFSQWRRPATWPPGLQFLAVLFFIIIGAALTESCQTLLTHTRNGSMEDALNDAAGGLFAFSAWHYLQPGRRPLLVVVALLSGLFLLIRGVLPLGAALLDEYQARQAFPVLEDFENPRELDRFYSTASHYSIEAGKAYHGRQSLRITFSTTKYSNLSLVYFNRNWQGYDSLVMEMRNDGETPLTIACRIHDSHHNQAYKDRFNRRFTLATGWNTIAIPLLEVRFAPGKRQMDMTAITDVTIFTVGLSEPRTVGLDYLRLIKQ